MNLTLGRGKNRQTFTLPSGAAYREMRKQNPRQAATIKDEVMTLVRRPANKVTLSPKLRAQVEA
jgi:hypothetical protein